MAAPPVMWAEEMEEETGLPDRKETIKDGLKTVTEYHYNDEDRRIKVVTQYKIVTKKVPMAVASRKKWKKFGQTANDPPGPNPATTTIGEEIKTQFIRSRSGELLEIQRLDDDPLTKLKSGQNAMRTCRYCKSPEHWSTQCPYKDMIEEQQKALMGGESGTEGGVVGSESRIKEADEKMKAGIFVPSALRGAARVGSTMMDRRDDFTVRVTNLPEDTTDQDLKNLFSVPGKIHRIFLAKDKGSSRCKGFAFVTYGSYEDAETAIRTITGHRYDHLILKVEWAKPSTT